MLSGEEHEKTLVLLNGGMNTLKSLKKQYRFAPLMLAYMKRCNYEKLKPKLIKASMSHIRNESAEEIAYAEDMFETIFKDYKREKDVHISGLLADLMNQTPVTAENFAELKGHILLISARPRLLLRKNAGRSHSSYARAADQLCLGRAPFDRSEGRRLHKGHPRFSRPLSR